MNRSRRSAALTMLVALALGMLPVPAGAAPAGVEGSLYLRNLTLPADGEAVEESLVPLLFADRPGWATSLTVTVDTSRVGVADVVVTGSGEGERCSTGPVVRCVLAGPHRVYERPQENGAYSYTTMSLLWLKLTPRRGASVGDTGALSVAMSIDGGPATTETAAIRIGEGVNLTAVDQAPRRVAPGGAVALRPEVRNSGATAVEGLTAVISADSAALDDTNFGNCTYGFFTACVFDTTVKAGATYRMSAPFTVRLPEDAAVASETALGVQWLTAAEWEDWLAGYDGPPEDRPGTGPALELDEVAVSAAGVPQADTDQDDNGSYTTVTVAGTRRTDVVAFGATVAAGAGERTITVGLVNRGPGTLHYPPFANNLPDVDVNLPAPMSVVTADDRCSSLSDGEDPPPSASPDETTAYVPSAYSCGMRSVSLRPGQRLAFTFTVRIAPSAHDEEGSVWVRLFGDGLDRDPGNNEATIRVTGAGGGQELPITGTVAATITSSGIVLLLVGAAVVVVLRRRPSPDGRH